MARMGLLLGLITMSLCCVGAQRKLTQSTAAPAAAGPSIVQDLLDVLGRNKSIGIGELEELEGSRPNTVCNLQLLDRVVQVLSYTRPRKLLFTQAWCTQTTRAPYPWVRSVDQPSWQ